VNEQLADESDLMNASPYDEGWIAKFEISSTDELEGLMDADEYNKLIGE